MTPVRVGFVTAHVIEGGAERQLRDLVGLLGPDWVSRIICLNAGAAVERLRSAGYAPDVIPAGASPFAILRAAWTVRRALRATDAQVVHADGVKAALVCAIAGIGTGMPLVWVKHDLSWDGWLARSIACRCFRVVAVSAAVAGMFGPRLQRKVKVIHTGIELHPADRAAGRRLVEQAAGGDPHAAAICLVGRFDPRKGHREVLAAAPALADGSPGLRILFIGPDDPFHPAYRHQLEGEIATAGLARTVLCLGFRADAVQLIAGCDVLVIPSVADPSGRGVEGFPYTGLEAMSVGTPVVAYAHGGVPEQLGDCGVLVPPADREALRLALAGLLGDASKREQLAECGRRRASRFSPEAMVAAFRETYADAAGSSL